MISISIEISLPCIYQPSTLDYILIPDSTNKRWVTILNDIEEGAKRKFKQRGKNEDRDLDLNMTTSALVKIDRKSLNLIKNIEI